MSKLPETSKLIVEIPVMVLDESDLLRVWFDEFKDALVSLELLLDELRKVQERPLRWKWVIVALQSSLQSCMVLALQGSGKFGVIHRDDRERWGKYLNAVGEQDSLPYPELKLASLNYLYERIKSEDWMKIYGDSQAFSGTLEQDAAVEALNEIRGDFMHYMPSSWGLSIEYLLNITAQCIPIIEFLAFESNNINWHHREPDLQEPLMVLITAIKIELQTMQLELKH